MCLCGLYRFLISKNLEFIGHSIQEYMYFQTNSITFIGRQYSQFHAIFILNEHDKLTNFDFSLC